MPKKKNKKVFGLTFNTCLGGTSGERNCALSWKEGAEKGDPMARDLGKMKVTRTKTDVPEI